MDDDTPDPNAELTDQVDGIAALLGMEGTLRDTDSCRIVAQYLVHKNVRVVDPGLAEELLTDVGHRITFAGPWVRQAVTRAVEMERRALQLQAVVPDASRQLVTEELNRRARVFTQAAMSEPEAQAMALDSVYLDACAGRFG